MEMFFSASTYSATYAAGRGVIILYITPNLQAGSMFGSKRGRTDGYVTRDTVDDRSPSAGPSSPGTITRASNLDGRRIVSVKNKGTQYNA